jgi:hypothetical protein
LTTDNPHIKPKRTKPSPTPLLRRLPTPLAVAILTLSVVTPFVWVATAHWHPLIGIVGAPLVIVGYGKITSGGRSFGPLWVELLGMVIVLGNVSAFILSLIVAIRTRF